MSTRFNGVVMVALWLFSLAVNNGPAATYNLGNEIVFDSSVQSRTDLFSRSDRIRTVEISQLDMMAEVQGAKPSITTKPETNVQETSVELNALVEPNGLYTIARFEFGTTTAYGGVTDYQPIDSNAGATLVRATVSPLTPNRLYHYRIVSSNSAGVTYGPDQTFTATPQPNTSDPWQFNCFTLESFQGGSTTDFDDLKVFDLDTGAVVYSNKFTTSAEATRGLTLYYFPLSPNDRDPVVNGTTTRVVGSQLRIQTTGFLAGGAGGYGSLSFAQYRGLPQNFRIEFTAQRLQLPGHMNFHVFHMDPSDTTPSGAVAGAQSRSHILRFAASEDRFQDYGLIYNGLGGLKVQQRTAPQGNPLEPHRIALSKQGNVCRWYLDEQLIGEITLPDIAPPSIVQPTANQLVPLGSSVTLSTKALGSGPLSFQWRRKGVNIEGATSETLSLQNVSKADAGSYDVVVANAAGTVASSPATLNVSDAFAPAVTTRGATDVTYNSATLTGTVNSKGLPTTAYFEYGLTADYGNTTAPKGVGDGTSAVNFSDAVAGLQHKPYRFRLVATNSSGLAYGEDQIFTPSNRSPQALADLVYAVPVTVEGGKLLIDVTSNDVDPDGDSCSVTGVTQAARGTVALSADNRVVYTPGSGYKGKDTFSYTITDGNGGTAAALVTILPAPTFAAYGVAKGDAVDGEPADAAFSTFGVPSINRAGAIAFVASYKNESRVTKTAIFAGKPVTRIVRTGDAAPGIAGATFKVFKDPVLNKQGHVAFCATVAGTAKNTDAGVWTNAPYGDVRLVAREGTEATGVPGAVFSQFIHLAFADSGKVVLVATLRRGTGGVAAQNDMGVWTTDSTGGLNLVLRKGDVLEVDGASKSVTSLAAFGALTGSAGQRRGFNADGELLIRVGFSDRTQALLCIDVVGEIRKIAGSGDALAEIGGAQTATFGLGILSDDGGSTFLSTLKPGVSGVTGANRSALLRARREGDLKLVMRAGDILPGISGAVLQSLGDPVANAAGDLAFIGRMRIGAGSVTSANDTAIWRCSAEGMPELIVREGDPAPGVPNGQFAAFTSIAFPSRFGVAFVGSLVKKGDVKGSNDTGLWAQDRDGSVQLLLREGRNVELDGVRKTVKSFTVLSALSGSPSQGHSYTDNGGFVCRIVFTDNSQGVFSIWLP